MRRGGPPRPEVVRGLVRTVRRDIKSSFEPSGFHSAKRTRSASQRRRHCSLFCPRQASRPSLRPAIVRWQPRSVPLRSSARQSAGWCWQLVVRSSPKSRDLSLRTLRKAHMFEREVMPRFEKPYDDSTEDDTRLSVALCPARGAHASYAFDRKKTFLSTTRRDAMSS